MNFEINRADLKNYPHFDQRLDIIEINKIVSDPKRVARNQFYPFIRFYDRWQPFRSKDAGRPKPKERPIRFAARRDAYIFSYYRKILSLHYEARIEKLGIAHCPIAYRKISKPSGGGKCNIDFAKDAFDEVKRQKNCVAIALDISSFFESLDHQFIYKIWCDLLDVDRLPDDHFAVFKNITKYHYVDQKELYRRLGYIQTVTHNGETREKYMVPFKKMPMQLCSPKEFREKVCGGDPTYPNLIKPNLGASGNVADFGVPQGAPISDLIANFYLMSFDTALDRYAKQNGGLYMRYSDDILLIIPGGCVESDAAEAFAIQEMARCGPQLKIKQEKTCVVEFTERSGQLAYRHLRGPQGKNGFEYLGFRFDGRQIFLRDSTLSRLYRKLTLSTKGEARRLVSQHPNASAEEIFQEYNYSHFSQRYMRVEESKLDQNNFKTWTFYSYMKRAHHTFGAEADPMMRQARNFKRLMKERLAKSVRREIVSRALKRGQPSSS